MEDTITATTANAADVERAVGMAVLLVPAERRRGGVRNECGMGNVVIPVPSHRSPPNPVAPVSTVADAACGDLPPRQQVQPQRNDVRIKIHGDGGDGERGKHPKGGGRGAEEATQTAPSSGPLASWLSAGKTPSRTAPGEGWAVLQAVMAEEATAASTSIGDDDSSSDEEGGKPNVKKSQGIHRVRRDSGTGKGLAPGGGSSVCHSHRFYRPLVTLALIAAALGAGLTIGRRCGFTDDDGGVPRHPSPRRPHSPFLPPPPTDLALACSRSGIATVDGLARCESACLGAEPCCWMTSVEAKVAAVATTRSCYAANRSACDEYRSHCHAVLGAFVDPAAADLSDGGDGAIVALPPPPSDLASLCSPGKILTMDGLALCESACVGASCCLLRTPGGEEEGGCYGGNEVACQIYREHCPVRP